MFKHFGFMYVHVHGAVSQMFYDTVVSSSLVGGSGTLHCGISTIVAALGPQRAMRNKLAEENFPLPSKDQKTSTKFF